MSPKMILLAHLLLLAACSAVSQPPATGGYELKGTPNFIFCPDSAACAWATWTPTPGPSETPTETPTPSPTVTPQPAPGQIT